MGGKKPNPYLGWTWENLGEYLALIAAVLAARRQDVRTVEFAVRNLHVGFS